MMMELLTSGKRQGRHSGERRNLTARECRARLSAHELGPGLCIPLGHFRRDDGLLIEEALSIDLNTTNAIMRLP